jgi:glycosyltransferase involved in cell wall biosynthesis
VHVLVDGFFLGRPYGYGRFAAELIRALSWYPDDDVQVSAAVPEGVDPPAWGLGPHIDLVARRPVNFAVWEQWVIPALARKLGCDVVHFPYNTRALWTRGTRTVTTVHDLLFLGSAPAGHRAVKDQLARAYARAVFHAATRRSDEIVSVSDTTARHLAARGIASEVVYNTVDGFVSSVGEAARPGPGPSRRYFLHRGGDAAHRNTGRVIDAFRVVRRTYPDVELRVVGVPGGARTWEVRPDEGITFLPRQTDAELATLYSGSACVVATALAEGFGLPIIEAFAFGTPVITSDRDPMREVSGGAALLVDPVEVGAIAEAMVSVLHAPDLATRMVDAGSARYEHFTAPPVAARMVEIYKRARRGGGGTSPGR